MMIKNEPKGAAIRLLPLSFLLFFLYLPAVFAVLASAAETAGNVVWIYDGDTIEVTGVGTVRLIGIDAPEKEDSHRDDFYLRRGISRGMLRRTAGEALHFLIEAVKNKHVTLQIAADRTDRHGRTLAYVFLPDGRVLNQVLLEKGLAAVYRRFEFQRKKDFLAAEARAQEKQIGMWRP